MPDPTPNSPLDMGSFTRCWSSAQDLVRMYVESVVWNPHDAEDVVQQVAYQAGKNYQQYDPARPFAGWVIGIAKNEVRMHLRKRSRDRHVFGDDVLDLVADTAQQQAPEMVPRSSALRECMKRVPDSGKSLLQMRYAEGLKGPELGDRLGLSQNAVLLRLRRLRAALGKCIEERLAREGAGHE